MEHINTVEAFVSFITNVLANPDYDDSDIQSKIDRRFEYLAGGSFGIVYHLGGEHVIRVEQGVDVNDYHSMGYYTWTQLVERVKHSTSHYPELIYNHYDEARQILITVMPKYKALQYDSDALRLYEILDNAIDDSYNEDYVYDIKKFTKEYIRQCRMKSFDSVTETKEYVRDNIQAAYEFFLCYDHASGENCTVDIDLHSRNVMVDNSGKLIFTDAFA